MGSCGRATRPSVRFDAAVPSFYPRAVPPDDCARILEVCKGALETSPAPAEVEAGDIFWLRIYSPIQSGTHSRDSMIDFATVRTNPRIRDGRSTSGILETGALFDARDFLAARRQAESAAQVGPNQLPAG